MTRYSKKPFTSSRRITLLQVLFLLLGLFLIGRLFQLQILKHNLYKDLAQQRYPTRQEFKPNRGEILVTDDGNLTPIATNQKKYLLFAIPSLIENSTSTLAQIEKVLPLTDEERWANFLKLEKKNDPYEPLIKNVTQQQKERLEKLSIENIDFEDQSIRVYPQSNLYADVLGFLGYRGNFRVGQYGIEEYFEKELRGKDNELQIVYNSEKDFPEIKAGSDIVLTLNPTVQFKICSILQDWQKKMLAEDGTAIVLNPQTGEVIAMCDSPSFDLNNYSQVENPEIYFNSAMNISYEPGSVFKPITMATAIDLEKVSPNTQFVDKGFLQLGEDKIRNADKKTYGQVDMTQILESSINTGIASVALDKIGKDNFKKYVKEFGFGEKTDITLPAESKGDISSLKNKGDIYTATASYGQGIMVTPLQLIMAYGALVNGGILMQPQIVKEIHHSDGEIKTFEPQKVQRVISSKTSNIIKAMLVSVVKNGHAGRASVDGYFVGGKTGTANIADKRGGYSEQTNHTFVGFAPSNNLQFVILVKLSKPKNVPFSSDSAAPAFAEMANYLLKYYQVPPDF